MLQQTPILCCPTGLLVMHSSGCVLDRSFFFAFSLSAAHSHPQKVTIPFLSACPARVTLPECGGSRVLPAQTNPGRYQRKAAPVLRPLCVCPRGEGSWLLWEECGIPPLLPHRILSTSHGYSKGSKQVLVLVVKPVLDFIIQLE